MQKMRILSSGIFQESPNEGFSQPYLSFVTL